MIAAIFGNILLAYLAADLIAGFWHWIEDRFFDEKWPIIGKYIAKPNTLHHQQPTAFLFSSYWTRNWTTIVPAGIAFLFASAMGSTFWMLTFAFVSQANEIHAWAHSKGKVSKWIEVLQETGLFQSPKHHAEHHRSPFDIRYCVMSDWLNPILDATGFWLRLEAVVYRLTGLRPKSE